MYSIVNQSNCGVELMGWRGGGGGEGVKDLLSLLATRDVSRETYLAARSVEGRMFSQARDTSGGQSTLSTQLIITCVLSDFARVNARKLEREQK